MQSLDSSLFGFITPLHFLVAKLDICLLKLTQLKIFILVGTWQLARIKPQLTKEQILYCFTGWTFIL